MFNKNLMAAALLVFLGVLSGCGVMPQKPASTASAVAEPPAATEAASPVVSTGGWWGKGRVVIRVPVHYAIGNAPFQSYPTAFRNALQKAGFRSVNNTGSAVVASLLTCAATFDRASPNVKIDCVGSDSRTSFTGYPEAAVAWLMQLRLPAAEKKK